MLARPYHPANLQLQPYARWRVTVLAWAGKLLGVQFHIHGIPFGAAYRPTEDVDTDTSADMGRIQSRL